MEQTRIVIVCEESEDPMSNNIAVYTNDPHADTEKLHSMLTAHMAYFIRNMMMDNVSSSEVTEMLKAAMMIAANRYMDNTKGAE